MIFTRKVGDSIRIGDDIVAKIVKVERRKNRTLIVHIGIDAPRNVPINRPEHLPNKRNGGAASK
jgi:carbon storage regulator CsrA